MNYTPLFNPRVAPRSRRQPHFDAHVGDQQADALMGLADKLGMPTELDDSRFAPYQLTLFGCTIPIRDDLVLPILCSNKCAMCEHPAQWAVQWGFEKQQRADLCGYCAEALWREVRQKVQQRYMQWVKVPLKKAA